MSQAPAFVEDDKLPLDVGRKAYSNTSHALCCLECGFEVFLQSHRSRAQSGRLYSLSTNTNAKKMGTDSTRTAKVVREVAEVTVLIAALAGLFFQSIGLATERYETVQNARRHGLSCMALVDPTVTTDNEGNGPLLQGVDPQTAVHLQRADPEGVAFLHSQWDAQITVLDGSTYRRCFGRSNSNNPVGTGAIFLNRDRLPSPSCGPWRSRTNWYTRSMDTAIRQRVSMASCIIF